MSSAMIPRTATMVHAVPFPFIPSLLRAFAYYDMRIVAYIMRFS